MATTLLEPLPPITRVGYDHGWHLLGPTFLNLGMPILIVDKAFLDPTAYGLEPFGTRTPHTPLPATPLLIECSGRFVGIRDQRTPHTDPIAIGTLADPGLLDPLTAVERIALGVGDTHALELSWAALWEFAIGIASAPTSAYDPRRQRRSLTEQVIDNASTAG